MSKKVAKFNAINGDKPFSQVPPDRVDKIPPYPRQAQFASNLPTDQQVRFMGAEVKSIVDQLNEDIDNGVKGTDLRSHCLQLHHQDSSPSTDVPVTLDSDDSSHGEAVYALDNDSAELDLDSFIYNPQVNW
jgi:hypothetical protein